MLETRITKLTQASTTNKRDSPEPNVYNVFTFYSPESVYERVWPCVSDPCQRGSRIADRGRGITTRLETRHPDGVARAEGEPTRPVGVALRWAPAVRKSHSQDSSSSSSSLVLAVRDAFSPFEPFVATLAVAPVTTAASACAPCATARGVAGAGVERVPAYSAARCALKSWRATLPPPKLPSPSAGDRPRAEAAPRRSRAAPRFERSCTAAHPSRQTRSNASKAPPPSPSS